MDTVFTNPLAISAFLCGVAGLYLVIRRTQKRRND